MAEAGDNGQETAKAAAAFAAYVEMGVGRSLRNLARQMVEQGYYETATTALKVLGGWSSKHAWQARLSAAITAKTDEALAKAAEIDAASFLRTSELVAERLSYTSPVDTNTVLAIRSAVRKPEPKQAGANLNLNLTVTLRQIVERVAAEQGLSEDEVMAEAESILAGG